MAPGGASRGAACFIVREESVSIEHTWPSGTVTKRTSRAGIMNSLPKLNSLFVKILRKLDSNEAIRFRAKHGKARVADARDAIVNIRRCKMGRLHQ